MNNPVTRACAALLCLVLASCVPPGSSTGGGGGGGKAVLSINNRPITADQLLTSPFLRESLRNLVFFETMVAKAKEAGVEIDEEEVERTFEEQKQQYAMGDAMGWNDFLAQSMSTEEEYKDQIRSSMYFEGLIKSKVNVTDEEMQQSWEENEQLIRDVHATQNAIPETEKANLTYEQVKETVKTRLESMKAMEAQESVMQEIIADADLKITGLSDKEKAKLLEDLIINNEKQRVQDSMKERAEVEETLRREREAVSGDTAPEGGDAADQAGDAAAEDTGADAGGH